MQITTTTIKHKRYSERGWKDLNPDGTLKNTLSQGEIGILLGDDLNTIIEVRIGIKDNSNFYDGMIISSVNNNSGGDGNSGGNTGGGNDDGISNDNIIWLESSLDLPQFSGKLNTLYIIKNSGDIYCWEEVSTGPNQPGYCVKISSPPPGSSKKNTSKDWWDVIDCGGALLDELKLGSTSYN